MRRACILFFLSVSYSVIIYGQIGLHNSDLQKLNKEISKSAVYDQEKEERITSLKNNLKLAAGTDARVSIINKLYEEYKSYRFDSALHYSLQLQSESYAKNDRSTIVASKLKTVFILLSGGLFKETFDSLNVISVAVVADSIKAEYYMLKAVANYLLAEYDSKDQFSLSYTFIANASLDSAIIFFPTHSFELEYYTSLKLLKKGLPDSAVNNLKQLHKRSGLTYHQIALITSTIGGILASHGKEYDAIPYLVQASIADIRSSTKETTALFFLADIIYKEGDIEDAVNYIEKANDDASVYNSRLRKVQIGAILPIIEGEMTSTIKSQKQKLQGFLLLISVLAFFLAVLAIITWRQVKKLKITKRELSEANEQQRIINEELLKANLLKEKYNSELQLINNRLYEANKIKEEYIGYYFNLDTTFITRIERTITAVEKKITERKWDEARFVLKSIDLKKEKDDLLTNFDHVFLKLFPNFVAQFNSLFTDDDKITLKEDQRLNTELRIFALIRLGITQNEKIAGILDYSINTIYAKKTKIRSKTIVSKDDFEEKLVEITTLQS